MEAAPRPNLGVGRDLRLDLYHDMRLAGHRVNIDVQHARNAAAAKPTEQDRFHRDILDALPSLGGICSWKPWWIVPLR